MHNFILFFLLSLSRSLSQSFILFFFHLSIICSAKTNVPQIFKYFVFFKFVFIIIGYRVEIDKKIVNISLCFFSLFFISVMMELKLRVLYSHNENL